MGMKAECFVLSLFMTVQPISSAALELLLLNWINQGRESSILSGEFGVSFGCLKRLGFVVRVGCGLTAL